MFLNLLFGSPAVAIAWLAAILISLTVHEFSHAWMSKYRGDRTAEREGRLTLNPIPHIDPVGLIPLLLFGFGWAKPVPFNPYNLKDPKWDSVRVALAGPASNLILAFFSAVILRLLVWIGFVTELNLLVIFLFLMVLLNLFLFFFNLIPIHPLDGSKLFFALFDQPKYAQLRHFVLTKGSSIMMIMIIFSLFTSINVFFFISTPAYASCNVLLGESCTNFLAVIFSGISS